jgi:serine/threonine protein kinase
MFLDAFCGAGMINEAMVRGTLEEVAVPSGDGRPEKGIEDEKHLDVRNNLSGTVKLKYALDMAEAVLLLHAHPGGVIVHDDIQLSQFLLDEKGRLKLNDFNRAEIMLFNEKDQEYCRYRNNPGHGDVSCRL